MPKFEITRPDGRKFEVTAPEGATKEQVLEFAKTGTAPKAASVNWRGEKPSIISERTPPPMPESGPLNPYPDPLAEAATKGRVPQPLSVGGVVGPLAIMAAPVLAGAAGPAAGAAKQGAQALEAWAAANPYKAKALAKLIGGLGLGAAGTAVIKYLK